MTLWWLLCAALWMLLDDTTALPELVDGAVAAAIGATGSTLALERPPARFVPRPAWARHLWRPWVELVTGLPLLIRVLARTLAGGDREPGELRRVSFVIESDPEVRGAQVALASFAGSVASNSVVVAVDERRGSMLVHELVPSSGRSLDLCAVAGDRLPHRRRGADLRRHPGGHAHRRPGRAGAHAHRRRRGGDGAVVFTGLFTVMFT